MANRDIEELDGSELGTKDYWDNSYNTEINNYKSHGDVGEVWFDEDSQIRVINWLLRNEIPEESSIIDLGRLIVSSQYDNWLRFSSKIFLFLF